MQVYRKPQEARHIEAQTRSRAKGARLEVIIPERSYLSRSTSRPGLVHHQMRTAQGFRCGCEGFAYGGSCLHLGGLARRSCREGWAHRFRIAPR